MLDEYECEQAKSGWRVAEEQYRRNEKNIAGYESDLDEAASGASRKQREIDEVNTQLYYLNDKISAKQSRISELESASSSAEPARRDEIEAELSEHRSELRGFENDRGDGVGRRGTLESEVAALESRQEEIRREITGQKNGMQQQYNDMVRYRSQIERACGSTSGFDLP